MRRPPEPSVELGARPACASAPIDETLVARELTAGPNMLEKSVVERFSLTRRGGCVVGQMLLRWKLGETALEVVWDEELRPLVAYKRMSFPGDASMLDERAYAFTDEGTWMVRAAPGEVETFRLKGERPTAVVPSGRGLFSAVFRRAGSLEIGESRTEIVVDLRRLVERIERGNVRRDAPREGDPAQSGGRVFTFMGRDTIFTDEAGDVRGDLAGLVSSAAEAPEVFEGMEPPFDAEGAWVRLSELGRQSR